MASMKPSPRSRAPSPTPTAFSGISNYRTDSYRPVKDKNAPPLPQIDYRSVSRAHFEELSKYLAAYLARGTFLSLYCPENPCNRLASFCSRSQLKVECKAKTHPSHHPHLNLSTRAAKHHVGSLLRPRALNTKRANPDPDPAPIPPAYSDPLPLTGTPTRPLPIPGTNG